ncbi:DUF2868 domain-containing protein [bacterium]|nr:DUF2868 domain-containing protein [bacterium]
MPSPQLTLADLIDLEAQMGRDAGLDRETLRRRDRAIGREISVAPTDRRELILAWLRRVRGLGDSTGERAARALAAGTWLLCLIGLVAGAGAGAALFHYDGVRPVNVVPILGLFVALPFALLLLLVLAAAPPAWLTWLPGARALQDLLRFLSPGRLAPALSRIMPSRFRRSLDEGLGNLRSFDRLYGRVRFWLLAGISQAFLVSLQIGALAAAMALVIFTDLAFAWSTTLQVPAGTFHAITHVISTPWAAFAPEAVPSLDLVEATRYFRQGGTFVGVGDGAPNVVLLGRWWPFLVYGILTYGLLPRVLTLGLSQWRYRAALRRIGLNHAPLQELYERLTQPVIESRAQSETAGAPAAAAAETLSAGEVFAGQSPCAIIAWDLPESSEAQIREEAGRGLKCAVEGIVFAGELDVATDERALDRFRERPDTPVVLLVKSWESPTRDLTLFLERLRKRLGDGVPILVAPVEFQTGDGWGPAERHDLAEWAGRMKAEGDPWLRTVDLAGRRD